MAKILLVDDEPGVLFTLGEVLEAGGHEPVAAGSGAEALSRLDAAAGDAGGAIDAVITDLSMPGMDGLSLLAAIRERDPSLPVVLLTARGSERVAVQAMKAGAYDYLQKPYGIDEVRLTLARALEARGLRQAHRRLSLEQAVGRPLVGESPVFKRVLEQAYRLADREVPVLVRGETGTGKELIASLLHAGSRRAARACVRFNCAAIPAELAEAELFGHARGAFTGAQQARRGFFTQADGGTLVLDEVGELPAPVQGKLLRALAEGEITPVGSGRVERVDVRVISCTHRDLLADVASGRFREDLYYRLAVVELLVPPLRERRTDIPALAEAFRRRYAARFGLDDAHFTPGLVTALCARDWPGNVRELENTVARALALSSGGDLDERAIQPAAASGAPAGQAGPRALFRDQVAAFERGLLARTLEETAGNQSEAARRLGLTRVTLVDKLKRSGLRG
jgi:two-component system, NtrC family, response regulator AtoC